MTETPALPFAAEDADRMELDALRAEVADLRRIRDAAEYITGPSSGCVDPEDRDCEEYTDQDGNDRPEVKWCSHIETRHATFADVHVRERLEALIDETLRNLAVDPEYRLDHVELADTIKSGIYSIAVDLEQQVDSPSDHITSLPLYRGIVDAEMADLRAQMAERRAPTPAEAVEK